MTFKVIQGHQKWRSSIGTSCQRSVL